MYRIVDNVISIAYTSHKFTSKNKCRKFLCSIGVKEYRRYTFEKLA